MLPKDIEDALKEQRDSILQRQSDEKCMELESTINAMQIEMESYKFRYQRRLKLDLREKIDELSKNLNDARSGKLLKDFETKISPLLDVYRRLSKVEAKVAPKLVRFADTKDNDVVLKMRRSLIEKSRRTELKHALLGDFCDECGVMMLIIASDSLLGCPKCAKTRAVPHASATSSMESDFVPNGSIKVKSRLLEWVQFSQAKECIEIDDKVAFLLAGTIVRDNPKLNNEIVLRSVREELEQNGEFLDAEDAVDRLKHVLPFLEKELKSVNSSITKKAMQSLVSKGYGNVRKLYENSAKYSAIISGFWPRRFNAEQEDRIRRMFTVAAPVYHSDRLKSSTLTFKGGYPYWLRCVCILNGWYEFLDHFPVKKEPRSSERETKRAEFWKKLNWEFVPSHAPLRPQVCVDSEGKQFVIQAEDFVDTVGDEVDALHEDHVGHKRKRKLSGPEDEDDL